MTMGPVDRKTITDFYARVCKDSGFKMDVVKAMQLTGAALNIPPLAVLAAIPFDTASRVADGSHPYFRSNTQAVRTE